MLGRVVRALAGVGLALTAHTTANEASPLTVDEEGVIHVRDAVFRVDARMVIELGDVTISADPETGIAVTRGGDSWTAMVKDDTLVMDRLRFAVTSNDGMVVVHENRTQGIAFDGGRIHAIGTQDNQNIVFETKDPNGRVVLDGPVAWAAPVIVGSFSKDREMRCTGAAICEDDAGRCPSGSSPIVAMPEKFSTPGIPAAGNKLTLCIDGDAG